MIRVTLKEHLQQLEASEAVKHPSQRRDVPSIPELAEAAGVTRATLYNLPSVQSVNLKLLDRIIDELNRQGFETELTDLLTTYPDEMPATA
jgi:DNA-binding Xre family transcriptional regulator